MDKVVFLEGEQIYLRGLVESDAEGPYWTWFNDAEVCRFNSHHVYPYPQARAREFVHYAQHTQDALVLAIIRKSDDQHVGNLALQEIHHINRTADLGFLIGDKDAWGKGIGSEAGQLLIDHGFQALNLHRITCGTTAENIPMRKLAERLGFTAEGTRRQAAYKNNRYVDIIEYGLLRSEWEARR
ncbi:MAG: GNAT family N-acetyltransferase [Solirubrobacterales bacterium]